MTIHRTTALALALLIPTLAYAADEPANPAVEFLLEGKLADGVEALAKQDDDQARFGLGAIEFVQAVEHLAQGLYRHGLRSEAPELPFVRLPVPTNPNPEPLTYAQFRAIVQQFADDLAKAADTLGKVKDESVKLHVPTGLIRLDVNADGTAADDERLSAIVSEVAFRGRIPENADFPVTFDYADVHWMIGYTHVLRALAEFYLAHDAEEFFDQTAFFFFDGAKSPYEAAGGVNEGAQPFVRDQIFDAIAALHLVHWQPTEPKRMGATREHLVKMIEHSRLCWDAIEKETDDDHEWIPNAAQTSPLQIRITEEQIAGWREFLDEAESILAGETLVPHWRVGPDKGINIRKVFEEPRMFDLVLWIHGAAAIPYLEEGDRTDRATWNRMLQVFGGNFLFFAVWVN